MQILVLCLGVWVSYHLWEIDQERQTNLQAINQLVPQGEAALKAKKSLFALVQDLNQTAGKDAGAAQVLREFKIQMKSAAPSGQ